MPLIAHISDLHFSSTTRPLQDALRRALIAANPALVAISGDLTQRAREAQFAEAQEFVESLPQRLLMIPGNHDVPLYDLIQRFLSKSARFRQYICNDPMPVYHDPALCVVGVDSTRAFTLDPYGFWKNGTLSHAQLELLREKFKAAEHGALKVLVMHHPLVNPWDGGTRDTVRGRMRIISILEQIGVDVVLSGHLHMAYRAYAPMFDPGQQHNILCIQAGTAISTRLRHEPNSLNLLAWDGAKLGVTVMRYNGPEFVPESSSDYPLR